MISQYYSCGRHNLHLTKFKKLLYKYIVKSIIFLYVFRNTGRQIQGILHGLSGDLTTLVGLTHSVEGYENFINVEIEKRSRPMDRVDL